MLVLSRKINEEIVIGENVKITVLQIKGNSIRLGIDAPKDIRIVRGELPPVSDPQMAGVTVVFNDDRNESGSKVKVIPFSNATAIPGRDKVATKPNTLNELGQPSSISFQERLPETLKRNRLQQIVNELNSK